jgi:hypothetical protein
VDGAPLQHFRVDFFDVLVKGAEHSDVAFQDASNVFDLRNQLLVLDVSLQDGVDDL